MTFIVLDTNPVRSAKQLCWLDCESAAFEGARIIITAFQHHGGDEEEKFDFLPQSEDHPLVRWAIVSANNARWLLRYTQAAAIKWGSKERMKGYHELLTQLNNIAARIDSTIPIGEPMSLFGNFYIDGESDGEFTEETLESNRAFYERTRKHLSWSDKDPSLYGGYGEPFEGSEEE